MKHLQIAIVNGAQLRQPHISLESFQLLAALRNIRIIEVLAESTFGAPDHILVELRLEVFD